jgi:hypothetical protein
MLNAQEAIQRWVIAQVSVPMILGFCFGSLKFAWHNRQAHKRVSRKKEIKDLRPKA